MKKVYCVFKLVDNSWKLMKIFQDRECGLEYICDKTLSDKLSNIIYPLFKIEEYYINEV